MDILSIFKLLAPLAPVAASIAGGMIAGPAGALAASKLTSLIMGKFGLPATATAEQLSDRIVEAGEETSRARINAAMEQARAEIAGFVEIEKSANELLAKSIAETNLTIRAETAGRVQLALQGIREHWFFTAGRPAALWVFNFVSLCFGMMLTAAAAKAAWTSPDPLKVLSDAWPLFAAYFGPLCAVNGIYINARSGEKKAAIENGVAMLNAKPPIPTTGSGVNLAPVPQKPAASTGGRIPDPPGSRP